MSGCVAVNRGVRPCEGNYRVQVGMDPGVFVGVNMCVCVRVRVCVHACLVCVHACTHALGA